MALSTLSSGTFAAESVTASQAQSTNKIGVVSVNGASTLDVLEAKLAKRTAAAGASGYSIAPTTNNNKSSGTAVIYKQLVGRIRRLRRIWQQMPDATLPRPIRPRIISPVQRKSASPLCLQSACRIGPWVLTCCVGLCSGLPLSQSDKPDSIMDQFSR